MSEIKPCPHCGGKAELYVREYTDLEANYGDARVDCVSEKCFIGGWHKPNNAIKAWNARPIEDDLAASRDRASDACATVQRERDELREMLGEALAEYAFHQDMCSAHDAGHCHCGFDAFEAKARAFIARYEGGR